MQIKFTGFAVLAVLASLLTVNGQSTNANDALTALDNIRETIKSYQETVWADISTLRSAADGVFSEYYTQSLALISTNVETISQSDAELLGVLDAEPNQALKCVIDAKRFVTQTIEFSGYQVSNCIQDVIQDVTLPDSKDALNILEGKVNKLTGIVVNSLIGHNIFTEYVQIEDAVNQRLATDQSEIDTELDAIKSATNPSSVWQPLIDGMNTCFGETQQGVTNALNMIATQVIPPCQQFAR